MNKVLKVFSKMEGGREMSDQEINIAIAEVVGWWGNIKLIDGIPFGRPPKITSEYIELPDYCGDLNAMHEAEKVLTADQWHRYDAIMPLRDPQKIHCTARQRAEAFLRVFDKWEE